MNALRAHRWAAGRIGDGKDAGPDSVKRARVWEKADGIAKRTRQATVETGKLEEGERLKTQKGVSRTGVEGIALEASGAAARRTEAGKQQARKKRNKKKGKEW